MIDPKLPRQFIACACIPAIILFSGFALFYDINMEVFKWVMGVLNFYPMSFFVVRQIEKRKQ